MDIRIGLFLAIVSIATLSIFATVLAAPGGLIVTFEEGAGTEQNVIWVENEVSVWSSSFPNIDDFDGDGD